MSQQNPIGTGRVPQVRQGVPRPKTMGRVAPPRSNLLNPPRTGFLDSKGIQPSCGGRISNWSAHADTWMRTYLVLLLARTPQDGTFLGKFIQPVCFNYA